MPVRKNGYNDKSIKDNRRLSWYGLLPIIFIVSVVPLIVFMKAVPLDTNSIKMWMGNEYNYDLFAYYKSVFLIGLTLLSLIVLLFNLYTRKIIINKLYIYMPLFVYGLFVLLSTIFSDHQSVSLSGFPDRYEGMYVLLSYVVITFITINLVTSEKEIKLILSSMMCSATIIGIIGFFQYIGVDLFKSSFGMNLILPTDLKYISSVLNFTNNERAMYSTLGNSNFIGSYMTIIFSIAVTFFIYTKGYLLKSMLGLMSLGTFTAIIASNSRAGLVASIVAVTILIVLSYKLIITNKKRSIGMIITILTVLISYNFYSGGEVQSKLTNILGQNNNISRAIIENITIEEHTVELEFVEDTFTFYIEEEQLLFKDNEDRLLDYIYDEGSGRITITDKQFEKYHIRFENNQVIVQYNLRFAITEERIWFVNPNGEFDDMTNARSWGFEKNQLLGSGRGYIWSRSIPMLSNTILVGYGPDTYALYFPQNDYVGKLKANMRLDNIIDKPHNIFLQIGINTGVISLIAFITIIGMYAVSSIGLYTKSKFENFYSIAGLSVFIAIVSYLVAGMFNDSVVSVAPVFWVILGIGIACNYKLKNSKEVRE